MKVRATKTFRGIEGLVRRGDVLDVSDSRGEALMRVGNVERYNDKMAAAPRNQMRRDPEPKGMTASNAGGLVTFGEGEGNSEGASAAPAGSPTGEAGSPSSSQAARAPVAPITVNSEGRRQRGRRRS